MTECDINPELETNNVDLQNEVVAFARKLRASLEAVVLSVTGPSPRPSDLMRVTGLDKSLAGRVIRAVRTASPLEALQLLPAPHGLRRLLHRAEQSDAPSEQIELALGQIVGFEQLIGRFQGRTELQTAISGWLPETLETEHRKARQRVFRAMAYLLGYQAKATHHCQIAMPSRSGDQTKYRSISVTGHHGLQRLRTGSQIVLSGIEGDLAAYETIEGLREPKDVLQFLLLEFSSQPLPRIDAIRRESSMLLALGKDQPTVGESVTIVTGVGTCDAPRVFATVERPSAPFNLALRVPARVATTDVYVHHTLAPVEQPRVLIATQPPPVVGADDEHNPDQHVPASAFRESFQTSATDLGNSEIPQHRELMERVFERAGHHAEEFWQHRIYWNYPVPGARITRWTRLQEQGE